MLRRGSSMSRRGFWSKLPVQQIRENKRNLILEWAASRAESRLVVALLFSVVASSIVWLVFARLWWVQTANTVERFTEHAWASRGAEARQITEALAQAKQELTLVLFWYQVAPLLELIQVNVALEFARDRTSVVTRSAVRHSIYLGFVARIYASFIHLPKAAVCLNLAKTLLQKRRKGLTVSGMSEVESVRELWEDTPNRIDDVLLTLAPLILASHFRRFFEWLARLSAQNRDLWSETSDGDNEDLALVPPDLSVDEYDLILVGVENDTRSMLVNIFAGCAWCFGLWYWRAVSSGYYAVFIGIVVGLWIFIGCLPRIIKLEELAEQIRRYAGPGAPSATFCGVLTGATAGMDRAYEPPESHMGDTDRYVDRDARVLAANNRRLMRSYESVVSPLFCCSYWLGFPYNTRRQVGFNHYY